MLAAAAPSTCRQMSTPCKPGADVFVVFLIDAELLECGRNVYMAVAQAQYAHMSLGQLPISLPTPWQLATVLLLFGKA